MHDTQDNHAHQRSVGFGNFAEHFGEVALVGTGFEHLCHGELPAQQRTGTGQYHQAHHDFTHSRGEDLGKHQTEPTIGSSQVGIRHDTGHHVSGNDIYDGSQQGTAEYSDRHVFLRVFHSIGVRAGRFQTKE